MRFVVVAALGTVSIAASADAGFLGVSAFYRTASNGNQVVDLVAVVDNSSDRLLSVQSSSFSNNAGAGGATSFIQLAGLSTRGWKPDAATSVRSNGVDSFMTIGVQGGAPYYGEYYASGSTQADANFTSGWTTTGNTVPANAGWFINPPATLPANLSESLANFTGTRVDSGAAAAVGTRGVWLGHFVMGGSTSSFIVSLSATVRDGVTSTTANGSVSNFEVFAPVPAPGALALLGLSGLVGRRRR